MRKIFRKVIATAGITTLAFFSITSAQAADPVPPTGKGIIIVVHHVINDNGGTRLAPDFQLTVMHWGTNVAGSPFAGSEAGTQFILDPGSYVVSSPVTDGYLGSWSGVNIENGFIDLNAGEVVTITRTTNDVGTGVVALTPVVPPTEDGGVLPSTSSPWFNALATGMLLSVIGVFGVRKFTALNK